MGLLLFFLACTAAPLLSASVPLPDHSPNKLRWEILDNGFRHLSSSLGCDACKFGVNILQNLFSKNATEEVIVRNLIKLCIDLKIEDDNVCNLVVREFKV